MKVAKKWPKGQESGCNALCVFTSAVGRLDHAATAALSAAGVRQSPPAMCRPLEKTHKQISQKTLSKIRKVKGKHKQSLKTAAQTTSKPLKIGQTATGNDRLRVH